MTNSPDTAYPIPAGPIDNPGNWRGSDFAGNEDWITRWSDQALEELQAAVANVQAKGLAAPRFNKADFPLPTVASEIQTILGELETGRGFSVIRGLPLDDMTEEQAEILFWGLMVHFGVPMSQNAMGHMLGHVRDLGLSTQDTKVRNYQTTEELFFHNDGCDVLMLLCRRVAKSGGHSRLASVTALFNAMWAEDKELTRELFRPFAMDRRGEAGRPEEGDDPFYVMPIFSYHQGLLTARVLPRGYIHSAQRFDNVPPLTERMNAALDLMAKVAVRPEVSFQFDLMPGDIELANNHCVLHSRTDFVDFEEFEKKRHMLRAWLSVPNSRLLPPWFESRWGNVAPGSVRGGIYPSRKEAA